jgi:hypothetical protein
MSGGGSRPSGGSGSGGSGSGSGSGGGSTTPTPVPVNPNASKPGYSSTASLNPSWAGGSTPTEFEPKDFGTNLFSDMQRIYKQGPQVFNKELFTPYGAATTGLINQGLGDVQANRNGVLGQVAGGQWLGGDQNPYVENALQRTRDNIGTDAASFFNSAGLYGSDVHARGMSEGMANAENDARMANFENEYARMMGAQGAMQQNVATGLGYGGLLDSKAQEKLMAEQDLFNRQKEAPFEHIAKNIGVLTGDPQAVDESTNQPMTIWDMIGGVGSFLGGLL